MVHQGWKLFGGRNPREFTDEMNDWMNTALKRYSSFEVKDTHFSTTLDEDSAVVFFALVRWWGHINDVSDV